MAEKLVSCSSGNVVVVVQRRAPPLRIVSTVRKGKGVMERWSYFRIPEGMLVKVLEEYRAQTRPIRRNGGRDDEIPPTRDIKLVEIRSIRGNKTRGEYGNRATQRIHVRLAMNGEDELMGPQKRTARQASPVKPLSTKLRISTHFLRGLLSKRRYHGSGGSRACLDSQLRKDIFYVLSYRTRAQSQDGSNLPVPLPLT